MIHERMDVSVYKEVYTMNEVCGSKRTQRKPRNVGGQLLHRDIKSTVPGFAKNSPGLTFLSHFLRFHDITNLLTFPSVVHFITSIFSLSSKVETNGLVRDHKHHRVSIENEIRENESLFLCSIKMFSLFLHERKEKTDVFCFYFAD